MSDVLNSSSASKPTAGSPFRRWLRRMIFAAVVGTVGATAWWNLTKPLVPGARTAGTWVALPVSDIQLLADVTTADAYSRPVVQQQIFDAQLRIIANARDFIVLDMFLFNSHAGVMAADAVQPLRAVSGELRDALIAAKRAQPQLRILLITDPVNDIYGGEPSPDLAMLQTAGVEVVRTDLTELRDPNPLYSSFWRLAIAWWSGDGRGEGWLPNPLDTAPPRVTFRAWAQLLNLKANHRKVLIADDGRKGLVGVVGSANPHDASSAHSNLALGLRGFALLPLLRSELEVARFSGWRGRLPLSLAASPVLPATGFDKGRTAFARVLTEGAIQDAVLEQIRGSKKGDQIDAALFYLSDREIIESLLEASQRGVEIRVLLDPNSDAFGHRKNGIPNRPMAAELLARSDGAIKVRWYRTHGEQFHVKMICVHSPLKTWFTLGSANFTRRNLDDFNLEANLAVEVSASATLAGEVSRWFDTLWSNRAPAGIEYTTDYGTYEDAAQTSYWAYRLMEASGLSAF